MRVESGPSLVAIGGTEGDVLEVAAVVEQGLEGWETHQ